MTFQFIALDHQQFSHLYNLDDEQLRQRGIITYQADHPAGFPCRISLKDAAVGARMLLLNYSHLDADSPYRASHAIFVEDGAQTATIPAGQVPEMISSRLVSIRAFDKQSLMVEADVAEGTAIPTVIDRFFNLERVAFIQVHTARRGCFMASVERVVG